MIEISLPTLTLLSGGLTSTIISSLLLYVMIGQVNRKMPNDQQIPYLFIYPGKVGKTKREHRRLYPVSRVNAARAACNILTVLFAIALAWRVGILRLH